MQTALKKDHSSYPIEKIRADFPILQVKIHAKKLVFLDNAASTQKPQSVIDRIHHYYAAENANIHRGVYFLSEQATAAFEAVRFKTARFLNAAKDREIIFVRGATDAINLVAHSFGKRFIHKGDEIILSAMEHHSNIVPWQMLCEERGAVLRVIPMNQAGDLVLPEYEKLLNPKTKLLAVGHISNALGTINPVKDMIKQAHAVGAKVLVDGAQAAAHVAIDVQDLDCDFYVFSGHKIYGPTGVGVLYGKEEVLEEMPPYQGGGDMIRTVTFEKTTYNSIPHKFEAGTPHIAGVIGLGSALYYVSEIGFPAIAAYENELLHHATELAKDVKGLSIIGTAKEKASILSFTLEGVHPHDIGTILDRQGIAIRAGHHCAQPVMNFYGVSATARASFALYNTKEEVESFIDALQEVRKVFP